MSNKLTFGKHAGKSLEWLFFNDPGYTQWLSDRTSKGGWKWLSWEQKPLFAELYRRASHLTGVCPWCKQRAFTRMCLIYEHGSGRLNSVSFDCDDCGYVGGEPVSYELPSFFTLERLHRCRQLWIVHAIKRLLIGNCKLTQGKMEEFFQTDHFFPDATPGFFDGYKNQAA
jgi:hypothetical protein